MKTALLFAAALFALPVVAQAPKGPTIDFTQSIHTVDGHPMPWTTAAGSPVTTLADLAITALESECRVPGNQPGAPLQWCTQKFVEQDTSMAPSQKLHRGQLEVYIAGNKAATLEAEDVAFLKERIAGIFGPLVMSEAWKMLDPNVR